MKAVRVHDDRAVPLAPGELAACCYLNGWRDARRLYHWLAYLYAASDGHPGLVTYWLAPLVTLPRGEFVRYPFDPDGPVGNAWTVESPGSGILAAGPLRQQLHADTLVLADAHVGVAQLQTPVDALGGDLTRRRLQAGPCLQEAAKLALAPSERRARALLDVHAVAADYQQAERELVAWLQAEHA